MGERITFRHAVAEADDRVQVHLHGLTAASGGTCFGRYGLVFYLSELTLRYISDITVALVRVSSKRLRTPDILDAAELQGLFAKLPDRERAMGTICATTGLRVSEALGLKWEDIDFIKGLANVVRSVVDGSVGRCKTEVSQQPVPLDRLTLYELQIWRSKTSYALGSDWVFASDRKFGEMPVWANTSLSKVLTPAARRAGITKTIGWHTFRHT
jgi:integrase